MWIRSQDKTVLVKAQGIYIDSRFSVWAEGLLLGEYSTKDKAIYVLDIIKHSIENKFEFVFYMPQDEDVEV